MTKLFTALVVCLAATATNAHGATLYGNVQTWGATPPYFTDVSYPAGRKVDAIVTVSYPEYDPYAVCGARCVSYSYVQTTYTDGGGNYAVDVPESNWGCYWDSTGYGEIIDENGMVNCQYTATPGVQVTVTSPGNETIPAYTSWNGYGGGIGGLDITKVPHQFSNDGKVWARRIGTGAQGVYLIEGFDGANVTGTPFYYSLYSRSAVNGSNLISQLGSGRTVWMIMYSDGGGSIMGLDGSGADGMAFSAMQLIQSLHDTHHSGQPAVVGGYSMGGLVAYTGLQHWCDGRWAGYGLRAGCNEVKLMIAADSPLDGATAVVSLQRYVKDNRIAGRVPNRAMLLANVNTWAAREMLKVWVTDGCSTDCNDFGGCSSYDQKFSWQCWPDNSRRDAFTSWSAGEVRRNDYSLVPAIALSMGNGPNGARTCTYQGWPYPANTVPAQFLKVDINNARDHHLYPNSAGGVGECDSGSRLNLLEKVTGNHGTIEKDGISAFPLWAWIGNYFKLTVLYHPTYIASQSSLLWSRNWQWRATWWNSTNGPHVPDGLPTGASSFILQHVNATTGVCVSYMGYSCDGGDYDYCYEGTYQCDGTCSDNTGTEWEVCGDWWDNNCDGQVDEYCGGGGCEDPYTCQPY
jgi:hypothetical protein